MDRKYIKRCGIVLALAGGFAACEDGSFKQGSSVPLITDLQNAPDDQTDDASPTRTFQEIFLAADLVNAETTQDADGLTRQEIPLVVLPESEIRFTQIDRPRVMDRFTQGRIGGSHQDEFALSGTRMLDLLVVVDDSSSMSAEQNRLASRLSALLSSISDTDWQLGIVTTTSPCLRYDRNSRGVIAKGDPNFAAAFAEAATPGIRGDDIERGVLNAIRGLQGVCPGQTTQPWLRAGASLGILFVTDEDNCGRDQGGCPGEFGSIPADLLNYLDGLKASGSVRETRAYGIYWKPGTSCSSAFQQANAYQAIVVATGGTDGSICDSDFSSALGRISTDVGAIVERAFSLGAIPDAGTLRVSIDSVLVPGGYSVVGSQITFDAPPLGNSLRVDYVSGSVPILDRFVLSESMDPNTLTVLVNGQSAAATMFQYDSSRRQLVFTAPPAEGAQIAVSYRRAGALADSVDLPGNAIRESLRAAMSAAGTPMSQLPRLEVIANRIHIRPPPMDGESVAIKYQKVGDQQEEYVIDRGDSIDMDSTTLEVTDRDTGAIVNVTYDEQFGRITVPLSEVVSGRVLEASYFARDHEDAFVVFIPEAVIQDSIRVFPDDDRAQCQTSPGRGAVPMRIDCGVDDVRSVRVTYAYWTPLRTTMELARIPVEGARIQVLVDGVEIDDFAVLGSTVTVPAELLQPTARITVLVSE